MTFKSVAVTTIPPALPIATSTSPSFSTKSSTSSAPPASAWPRSPSRCPLASQSTRLTGDLYVANFSGTVTLFNAMGEPEPIYPNPKAGEPGEPKLVPTFEAINAAGEPINAAGIAVDSHGTVYVTNSNELSGERPAVVAYDGSTGSLLRPSNSPEKVLALAVDTADPASPSYDHLYLDEHPGQGDEQTGTVATLSSSIHRAIRLVGLSAPASFPPQKADRRIGRLALWAWQPMPVVSTSPPACPARRNGRVIELGPRAYPPDRETDNPLVLDSVAAPEAHHTADFQLNPSGVDAVFTSTLPLTGYDSASHHEVFRYDASAEALTCVSCNQTGEQATGEATLASNGLSLTDDGRVFFNSTEGLVDRDLNENEDVYEWEPQGMGPPRANANRPSPPSPRPPPAASTLFPRVPLPSAPASFPLLPTPPTPSSSPAAPSSRPTRTAAASASMTLAKKAASPSSLNPPARPPTSATAPAPPPRPHQHPVGRRIAERQRIPNHSDRRKVQKGLRQKARQLCQKAQDTQTSQASNHNRGGRQVNPLRRTQKPSASTENAPGQAAQERRERGVPQLRTRATEDTAMRRARCAQSPLRSWWLAAVWLPATAQASEAITNFTTTTSTTIAGAHPDLITSFELEEPGTPEAARNIVFNAPSGVFGDPSAITRCTASDFALDQCPSELPGWPHHCLRRLRRHPQRPPRHRAGLQPRSRPGQAALFAFIAPNVDLPIDIPISVRTGALGGGAGDYGLRFTVSDITQLIPLAAANLTVWGFPAEAAHNTPRFPKGSLGEPANCLGIPTTSCIASPTQSAIPVHPFTSNPTTCTGQPLETTLEVQTYADPEHLPQEPPRLIRQPPNANPRSSTRLSAPARPRPKPTPPLASTSISALPSSRASPSHPQSSDPPN